LYWARRLLLNAYQLDDGRRGRKSEDGKREFDEQGNPVSEDVVQLNGIPNHTMACEELQSITDRIESH
jgi:hypothetical protein